MSDLDVIDPLLGAVLDGRYRIVERIGAGGMGTVYRARQLTVERDVAVKFLRADAYGDPRQVRRFEREARMIARLRDPHTLKLIDFGRRPDGQLYLVCEFLEGEPLDRRIARGPLAAAAALDLLRPVCDALAEAHAEGIVHRDLKPGNLFIERVGARELVKVLDFGIARWSEGEHSTTGVSGTPAYMAPEQARGVETDHRCDLYALGAVLYACLAGRAPYLGSGLQVMLQAMAGPPPAFAALSPPIAVPPEVAALVFRLMATDAADRPQSATEVAAAFDRLRHEAAVRASAPAAGLSAEVTAETLDAGRTPPPATAPLSAAHAATLEGRPSAPAIGARPPARVDGPSSAPAPRLDDTDAGLRAPTIEAAPAAATRRRASSSPRSPSRSPPPSASRCSAVALTPLNPPTRAPSPPRRSLRPPPPRPSLPAAPAAAPDAALADATPPDAAAPDATAPDAAAPDAAAPDATARRRPAPDAARAPPPPPRRAPPAPPPRPQAPPP
ncbi:MAG: protein kinase [Myxococcales bacterium]|nr:protein kinase [Myxococcales bacterium]